MSDFEHFFDSNKCSTLIDEEEKNIASTENKPDMINHPRHYCREGAIECIDEIEMIFGPEVTMHFCLGNVLKYRYRAGLKNNGYEDLEKSDWYMRKYKELREKIDRPITNQPEHRRYTQC